MICRKKAGRREGRIVSQSRGAFTCRSRTRLKYRNVREGSVGRAGGVCVYKSQDVVQNGVNKFT